MKEIVVRVYPDEVYVGVAFSRTGPVLHCSGFFSNKDSCNKDFDWANVVGGNKGFILDFRDCEQLSDPKVKWI